MGTGVDVSAYLPEHVSKVMLEVYAWIFVTHVATTALIMPISLLNPMEMPLPVPRCAEGRTSGVYAYNVP